MLALSGVVPAGAGMTAACGASAGFTALIEAVAGFWPFWGRALFGGLEGEEAGLGGFGGAAGAVGLGLLVGEAVPVQGRVLNKIECLWRETEFVLGDWQAAAAVAFHGGGGSYWLVCRVEGRVFLAGVLAAGGAILSAWVLPNLALPVPMESKL